jgi:hypothetical protein
VISWTDKSVEETRSLLNILKKLEEGGFWIIVNWMTVLCDHLSSMPSSWKLFALCPKDPKVEHKL